MTDDVELHGIRPNQHNEGTLFGYPMVPMTEKIEPALTPEEWTNLTTPGTSDGLPSYTVAFHGGSVTPIGNADTVGVELPHGLHDYEDLYAAAIAVLNCALPDSDPRKITRAKVEAARFAAQHGGSPHLDTLIAALESYLPPEHS